MSIHLDPTTRNHYIQIIQDAEVERFVHTMIEHFAVPFIAGISMDQITQQAYNQLGGKGQKPPPLPMTSKQIIYQRIEAYLKPKIQDSVQKLVKNAFANATDILLQEKANKLKDKPIKREPDWNNIEALFTDHLCLFKELAHQSFFTQEQLIHFHDAICPIISRIRDSNEFPKEIHLDEFLF